MKYCVELRPMRSHDFSMYHSPVNNEMVLSQIFTAPDFNCLLYTVCKSKISIVKKNTFYSKYLYNTICSSKFLQKIKITQLNFSMKNQNQSLSENPKIWYDRSRARLPHSALALCSIPPKGSHPRLISYGECNITLVEYFQRTFTPCGSDLNGIKKCFVCSVQII